MKTVTKTLVMVAAIGLATAALAKPPHPHEFSAEKAARITEEKLAAVDSLELNDSLATEVKALITSHEQQVQELMAAHHQAMKDLHEQHQTEIEKLLSDDEQAALDDAMRDQMRKNFKKHGGKFRTEPKDESETSES